MSAQRAQDIAQYVAEGMRDASAHIAGVIALGIAILEHEYSAGIASGVAGVERRSSAVVATVLRDYSVAHCERMARLWRATPAGAGVSVRGGEIGGDASVGCRRERS